MKMDRDAIRMLQWLVHAARSVSIQEMAEVLAVDIDDNEGFEP